MIDAESKPNQRVHVYSHEEHAPTTLFSHGIGADYTQADFYKTLFCSKNYITFNYPNAPEKLFTRNHKTGLAQKSEIEVLDSVVGDVLDRTQHTVLYGLSRGASVIINVLGSRVKSHRVLPNIKAVILESPFAHCEDAIKSYAELCKLPPFFVRFLVKRFFREYDKSKNAPIDWVKYIPHDIPILFICTAQDTIVPASSTRKLYARLRKDGHKKVHILEFPEGIHANLVWSIYGREYHTVLHAFYRAYDLPHDEQLAEIGKERFERCQPEL